MSALEDDLLQRYFDGELSGAEERGVRDRVDRDPRAQRRLRELSRLSELLQTAADEMGRDLNPDALFARIEANVDAERERQVRPALRVIVGEWAEHRRHAWVPVAAAGAIAAAALLMVLRAPPQHAPDPIADGRAAGWVTEHEQSPSAEEKAVAHAGSEAQLSPPGSDPQPQRVSGSQVEDVDFGSHAGTVFAIEAGGTRTAVVWITDEG